MKLIKIGRLPSCNIVLHSDKVSSIHAEMLILDTGEILLEDKNSLNGTYVGKTRINPGEQVPVRPGDFIQFADTDLNWAFVPKPDSKAGLRNIINIGTHHMNDIVLTGNFASRFHAVLKIAKDGKAYIRDIGSKNGTIVKGSKIDANKDIRIKRKDQVVCGDVDITEQIEKLIPDPWWYKLLKVSGVAAGVAAAAALIFYLINPTVPPQQYSDSVAYVRACYHYTVTFEDNPIPDTWSGVISLDEKIHESLLTPYQATAFFIDENGYLATNRHVAVPWEYRTEATENTIKNFALDIVTQSLLEDKIKNQSQVDRLCNNELGLKVARNAVDISNGTEYDFLQKLNRNINRIKNSPLKISGEIDYITVGYRGRYYTHADEFDRCHVVTVSDYDEQDIALLRMNNKVTPSHIDPLLDIKRARTDKLVPLGETLYTIGYPAGLKWGQDDITKSLQPEIREVKCGKEPGKYTFEFQGESVGGASGSPIFDKKGQLVGVLWGGWANASTFGLACQAKYLIKMYNEEVGNE